MHYLHPKRGRGDIDDGIEVDGNVAGINDDSKESAALKGKKQRHNPSLNDMLIPRGIRLCRKFSR